MHRENKKRKIIIFSLLGILLLMAAGYAAFKTNLNITGTSNITSVWDVRITNVKVKETSGLAENVGDLSSYTNLDASMEANFYEPGDYITYTVTVSNKGTLDAMLDSVKLNIPEQDVINFKVEGAISKDPLPVGKSKDIDVTMEYTDNNSEDVGSVEADVNLDYVQDGRPTEFPGADSPEEDNLRIKDIILTPDETSVKAEIDAEGAIKYYYSIDNNTWYESSENIYNIYHLKPNTPYTLYVKAEGNNGKVVYSSKPFTTLDKTSPKVNINIGDNVKGENGWYKGLSLITEVTDNDKVKEVLYCVGQDCTPNKSLSLTNNKATITLESNKDSRELCIKATDMVGNTTNKCSSEYKVDGNEPTLSNMNIETKDDVMEVTITGSDNESGLYKYYYSKDGGKTYIESDNPNYTFTGLDEGDYLVTAYVKDIAGNESEIKAQSTAIRYTSYCKKNGIEDFGDCLIATEAQNPNIEEAKKEIEAKGTPDFTKTSPSILYDEKHATTISTWSTTSTLVFIGTGYEFNPETGMYTITGGSLRVPSEIDLNDGNTYYTTRRPDSVNGQSSTSRIVDISSTTNSETGAVTTTITYYNYTQTPKSYDTSTVGMYADSDDDGNTYYYRGSTASNYVKFGGYYWRAIRVNGDGTVRLIYDGKQAHANGESNSDRYTGWQQFNVSSSDNTYVGYMYANPDNFAKTNSGNMTYDYSYGVSSTARYYFGTSYIFDEQSKRYKLSGEIIQGTIDPDKVGYYTFFSTDADMTRQKLYYTRRYNSPTSMQVSVLGYGTTSKEQSQSNDVDSEIKTYLDNWYKNNLNSYTDMLSKNAIFCNNRTPSNKQSGSYNNAGYGLNPTIYGYERYFNYANQGKLGPTLSCQLNDSFSVSNVKGNGKLKYPVGLITMDEVNMAGGVNNSANMLYYLYIGKDYWTMTPSYFDDWFSARVSEVYSDGSINRNSPDIYGGIRPVINIDPSKITFSGNGTMSDPYVIE